MAVACTTVTTRYFMPSSRNPTYRPGQAVPVLTGYVRLQCPALRRAARADSGHALLSVEIDTLGYAARARLTRATGDSLLDDVFGTVAAQLTFPRDSTRRRVPTRNVRIDFRCVGDSAIVRIDAGSL